MKDQVHIRNAEAAQLARALARENGKTISDVVLEALRQYRSAPRTRVTSKEIGRWRELLHADRKGMARPEKPVEALYDDFTGLPG
jgi:hypothetical protein